MDDMFVVPISEFDRERLLPFARSRPAPEEPFNFRKSGTRLTASKKILDKAMQDFKDLNDTAREEEIEASLFAFSRNYRLNQTVQDETFEDELGASFIKAMDEGRDRVLAKIDRGDYFPDCGSSGSRGNQIPTQSKQHIGPLFSMRSIDLPQSSGTDKNKKQSAPKNIPVVSKSIRQSSNSKNYGMNSANSTISIISSKSKIPATIRTKSPAINSLKISTKASSKNVNKVSAVVPNKPTKPKVGRPSKMSSTKTTAEDSSSMKSPSSSSVNQDRPRRYKKRASTKAIDYSDDRNCAATKYGISKAQKLSTRSSSSGKQKVENKTSGNSTSPRNVPLLSSKNSPSFFNKRYGRRSTAARVNYSEARNQ
ncbi:unnamed protein product [Caenorhabditis angaria]|uniref:Uncharacterized protein n=1 Tax=Caenorhabditis angaria TaxID=860376 RepID=A0A9P1I3K6_9PELO|nr:unnamed protein product [Caenorhabditis angaria]